MILRLSDKLGRRLRARPTTRHPLHANAYADWSADYFRADRDAYILVANTKALYTVLLPAGGLVTPQALEARIHAYLAQALKEAGLEFFYKRLVERDDEPSTYSTLLNAESEAVLRDLAELAAYFMVEEGHDTEEAALRINRGPLAVLDRETPAETFRSMRF